MQLTMLLDGGQCGVAVAPKRVVALRRIKTNSRRGAGQFTDNRTRLLVSKVKHHIVPLLTQRLNELLLYPQLIPFSLFSPVAIETISMVDIGVGGEHIPGLLIQQHIHADDGTLLLQRVNKRRDQQHVAMTVRLNDQDPRRVQRVTGEGFRRHTLFFIQDKGSDSRGSDRLREALYCSAMTRYV